MNYRYQVITALSRFDNIGKLIPMLDAQQSRLDWHVITDLDLPFFPVFRPIFKHVHAYNYHCPNSETTFFRRCNFAINWWLDTHDIAPDDRFCFLNDDDGLPPDFFSKIDQHEGEVVICSMERGQHTPAGVSPERAHGTTKLIAAPENMHPGGVGVEQIILAGKILKDIRLPMAIDGDGQMVQHVCSKHAVTYAPEISVLFNRFEKGRWDE